MNFRSTDPRPKKWVLLSKTEEEVDANDDTDNTEENGVRRTAIRMIVDGGKYVWLLGDTNIRMMCWMRIDDLYRFVSIVTFMKTCFLEV